MKSEYNDLVVLELKNIRASIDEAKSNLRTVQEISNNFNSISEAIAYYQERIKALESEYEEIRCHQK
jgi:FtsZ-binding cell division protein ZapB